MRAMQIVAVAFTLGLGGPAGLFAQSESGEVWVTSQGTDRVFIVHGDGAWVETVTLPAGAGPHLTTFSPLADYAYVSGMGSGDLYVLRADTREIVATLDLGSGATHQARPSPDGSVLLVTQVASQTLIKVAADEATETWGVAELLPLPSRPICSIFRDDGQRAYVSLLPSGIGVIDVATFELESIIPTDGFVACGMVMSKKGRFVTLASSGSGGHVYRLDTATDTLTSLGTLGAPDWHSFVLSPNEKFGFGSAPRGDALAVAALTDSTAHSLGLISVDATPGPENDQPDNMGVRGSTLYASLRASGKLAIVNTVQRTVKYVQLSDPAPFNPATCSGCAVHGIAVRP